MSAISHLNTLQRKNEIINKEIKHAFNHYSSDEELKIMKRKRLRIQEEIAMLSSRLDSESIDINH